MNEPSLSETARTVFLRSLADCGIDEAFRKRVKSGGHGENPRRLLFGEHCIDFAGIRYLRIVAAGKAASSMLNAFLARLPALPGCEITGVLIGPDHSRVPIGFQAFRGGHPFPNEDSLRGARSAISMLRDLPAEASASNSLLVFLVSGGASAMMELPLDPKITLDDTIAFHRALVHSGASITEINCVRKHFSAVKGGRLALTARHVPCLTIALSDVPPGKVDTIASGPTLPDSSTVAECGQMLAKYDLLPQFPHAIRRFFSAPEIPETVKAGEISPQLWVLLSGDDLAQAAARHAEALGYACVIDNTCDDWDYRPAAGYLLQRIRELRRSHRRVCLLSVGEITVQTLRGLEGPDHPVGNGGRNQHFALHVATLLNPGDESLAILSAGSDGIDGHSNAAGAVVSLETLGSRSQMPEVRERLRASALAALERFESSTFLESMGARIVTGPTGNNLRDLRILIAES